MSTTFKLTYDPTEAKRGFELLAQSIRAAQAAGATLPPELVAMANRMEQVEVATADAAVDTNRLETEIEQLTAAARLADDRLGSYAISTQQVGNAATAAAGKVQQQASAIERTGKVVGSTREGLEKLTGAATALGNESAEVTKGMGILAGVIAAVASPIGAVVAIAASLVSIFKSLREGATGLADDMNPVDSVLLKIASTMGLISEEAARAGETLKNDLATERFAEAMKKGEERAREFAKAVMEVGRAIEAGRQSREEDAIINAIGDPEAIAEEIDRLREKMEGLANSQALSAEELEAYRERINKLEARRIALLDEQKKKEDEAYASRWKSKDEEIKQEDERHEQRMDNIDTESQAEQAAAEEKRRRDEQSKKAVIDRVMAEMNGVKQVSEEKQQAFDAEQQRQEQARNPYGEGQALDAGGGSNPYAAAIDPLGTALGGGFGEQIGEQTGGGSSGRGSGGQGDLIRQLADQIQSARPDISDRQAQREARSQVRSDLQDGTINDPAVARANEELINKNIELNGSLKGLTESQIETAKEMAKQIIQMNNQVMKAQREVEAVKSLLIGNRPQFSGGNPRRMGG